MMKRKTKDKQENLSAKNKNEFSENFKKNEKIRKRNIYTSIISSAFVGLSLGLLNGLLDYYVNLSFDNPKIWLGSLTMIKGITTMISSLPIGFAVDMFNRIHLSKFTAFMSIISGAIGVYSFWFEHTIGIIIYACTAQVAEDLNVSNSAAILNDHIKSSEKEKIFSTRSIISSGISLFAVAISAITIFIFEEKININLISVLLTFFITISRLSLLIFSFIYRKIDMSDMTEQSMDIQGQDSVDTDTSNSTQLNSPSTSSTASTEQTTNEDVKTQLLETSAKYVPYIIFIQTIILSMGSGMLVQFAPYFLIDEIGMTRSDVNILGIALIGTLMVCTYCLKYLIKFLGKPFSSITLSFIAISILHSFTYLTDPNKLKLAFVLRGAVQNAGLPIDQMLITDYTHSKDSGKWNAAYSFITIFSSLSAYIGGRIADSNNYRLIFKICTAIYLIGNIFYSSVLFFVKDEDKPHFLRKNKKVKVE